MPPKGPAPPRELLEPVEFSLSDLVSHRVVPMPIALPSVRSDAYATLLEAIVRSSEDAIITKDLNSIITSWNPAATAMFGYQPEEIIGSSILSLIPPRLHHEETEVIRRLRAGEQIEHFETFRLTRDGREIAVSLTISPLKNKSGEVIGASKIARNITQRRLLERARLQLAAIVESSEDAIVSKHLDGTITSWNAAAERVFGYKPDEIIGRSVLTLIPPELQHEEPIIISKLVNGERIEHFETIRIRKNGERFDASLTISPIRDQKGRVIGASKILRDISDRRRMQQSLLQAEKLAATGRMAASIAHEINNPLEGLLNLIYLARTGADDPAQVRSLLETAENELARVAHIAKQTLGYYRENASPTRASLAEIARDVLRIYGPRLTAAGIKIHTVFPPAPTLMVKRGEIMQVLSNLLANSLHAMPTGGELTLTLRTEQRDTREFVLLDVTDTGVGIPEENLRRIFDAFFTTRTSIGTGIGLWVARQFIESHGGTLTVSSSTAPRSHGTTMTIALPADITTHLVQ